MKYYILFLSILALWLFSGCSDDQGNYDYEDLNTITIDSIKENYTVIRFDSIEPIEPVLTFKFDPHQDLSFEWKVNYKTVSDKKILNVAIDAPLGTNYATLFVTDNHNGVKYYKDFKIKVNTSYSDGLFILSEKTDKSAMLSYLRRDKKNGQVINEVFELENPRQDHLGNYPQQIAYSQNMKTRSYNYYIICKEGIKKIATLNANTMQLEKVDNETTVMGGYTGDFYPTMLTQSPTGGFAVSEGKAFTYNAFGSGNLNRPIPGDYELAWTDFNHIWGSYAQFGYDRKNHRFVVFTQTEDDMYSYDQVSTYHEIEGFEGQIVETAGLDFVAGGATGDAYSLEEKKAILCNKAENKAYFYTLNTTLDLNAQQTGVKAVPPYGLTLDMTKENFLSEQGVYKFASLNRYWYIANGRTITRLFWNEGGTTKTFTLPAEAKGEVTAMAFDEDETELYVGLYDAGSTNEYKGAIAILNPETGELLEYIVNAGEKIVDLFRKE